MTLTYGTRVIAPGGKTAHRLTDPDLGETRCLMRSKSFEECADDNITDCKRCWSEIDRILPRAEVRVQVPEELLVDAIDAEAVGHETSHFGIDVAGGAGRIDLRLGQDRESDDDLREVALVRDSYQSVVQAQLAADLGGARQE